jgi:outer membrane lipoprotein carrier protein
MNRTASAKNTAGGCVLFCDGPLAAGQSQTPSLDEIVTKVQKQYDTHADFKAQFIQESMVKSLGKKQSSEGTVYFKKPGKMRWTYQKPFKQEIISDGKTL